MGYYRTVLVKRTSSNRRGTIFDIGMKIVMLEDSIFHDVVHALDWAINRAQSDGDSFRANKTRLLKSFLISPDADLPRKGGQSKSEAKRAAARQNAKKGGAPGTYYACVNKANAGSHTNRRSARYFAFTSKEDRNLWVQQAPPQQRREALPATDTDLRWCQRNHPEQIGDGDAIIQSHVETQEMFDQFERYHDLE